jgi:thiol-disulfide isomerase/thioredoxin
MTPKRFTIGGVAVALLVLATIGISYLSQSPAVAGEADDQLTDAELQLVVAYIVEQLKADPKKISFADEEIEEATGVRIPEGQGPAVQSAVLKALFDNGIKCAVTSENAACATSDNRCTQYAACSLYGDLAGASGETLEMYKSEKAQDGTEYTDFTLPEFEAVDLNGNKVHSSDLAGRPAVLVTLAGHCGHSIGSIGVLQKVAEEHKGQDVRVIGVFLNSGSSKDVKTLVDLYKVDYEVWVYPDASLGDKIDSHLVPTYLYVDADGSVKKKLVGMKDQQQLTNLVASYGE